MDNIIELVESQVSELIQHDDYYQGLATPLKSAAVVKQEHKTQLSEVLNFKEQRIRLNHAQKIIIDLMPTHVSPAEVTKINEEFDKSVSHFSNFKIETDKPLLFQDMLGFSDETLLHIYSLGLNLVKIGQFQDALALFNFLTMLTPHVTSYWILEGICFQHLNLHKEALAAFSAAKFLNPIDPLPIAYSIECYRSLKETDLLRQEVQLLEKIVTALEAKERDIWYNRLNLLKMA